MSGPVAIGGYRLDELEFYAGDHRYLVRGRELPSVTTLMRQHGIGFQGYAPQSALDRGNFVHEASLLIDEDDLHWPNVPEAWRGYCEAYAAARKAEHLTVVQAEGRVWHPHYRYAGTLDRVVLVLRDRLLRVRELKTGDASDVECQVAAYVQARNCWYPHDLVDARVGECLKLNHNGTFRLYDIDLEDGWRGFSACLILEERVRRHRRAMVEAA